MDIETAKKIAIDCHDGQKDKLGEDYIEHIIYVVRCSVDHIWNCYHNIMTDTEFKQFNENVVVVAWLHDVFEDCDDKDYTLWNKYKNDLNEDQRKALITITKRDYEEYGNYVREVRENKIASVVKRSDLIHNMNKDRLAKLDKKTAKRLKKKYCYARGILEGWVE